MNNNTEEFERVLYFSSAILLISSKFQILLISQHFALFRMLLHDIVLFLIDYLLYFPHFFPSVIFCICTVILINKV